MKILHFITSINTGGAEKFCVDICNTQANNSDDEIYLCVLDCITKDQPLVKMISSNVTLISLNKKAGYSLKILYKIYQQLLEINPDVIHLNGRSLVYASIPIIIKKIPAIYTVHTMADKEYGKYIKKYNKFIFTFFSQLFTPVAISKSVLESVKITYGNRYKKVIYNGSSKLALTEEEPVVSEFIKHLKKDENTLVFLYIGRIREVKNTLLLIKAVNKLLDDHQNVCLCVVGYDGSPDQSYLLECKTKNRYSNRIKFVGRKENIADFLLQADALCLTSSYEGLGIAAIEAFSIGKPVLTTPSGGPSELIVSGVNGYVSTQISVESYIDILYKFIEKPLNDNSKIKNIYQEKYTMNVCASKYLELYEKKINENK